MPPPTPVPPQLLADADPQIQRLAFGPATRSQQWLITRNLSATFSLFGLRGQQSRAAQPLDGEPLSWTPEGALLLFTSPGAPDRVWALEPTTGITTTVLTTTFGPIGGLAWLDTAIIYAVAEADGLALVAMDERSASQVVARLPERRLIDGGLLAGPDQRSAALLVVGTVTPTVELYYFDNTTRQLSLIDTHAANLEGAAAAQAVWSLQGDLAYSLGNGLRRYSQTTNRISAAGFPGAPYDWLGGGVLARGSAEGALVRWRDDGIQPFDTGSGPLIASDAQAIGRNEAVLLIGQQIWRVTIP
ncbi:MAG: hypothetical protein H0T53_17510 [Herpetosiphonaceae bacterium]|nr:hypothetical protein [Herpetosiphonaceae bacterium]